MSAKLFAVLTFAIVAVLTITSKSKAEETIDCDGSTYEMHICIGKKVETADKALNAYYQTLIAKLNTDASSTDEYEKASAIETKARLVKAERAWIAFRDAECNLAGVQMLGGSGEGLVIHGCLLGMTEKRLEALKMTFEP